MTFAETVVLLNVKMTLTSTNRLANVKMTLSSTVVLANVKMTFIANIFFKCHSDIQSFVFVLMYSMCRKL